MKFLHWLVALVFRKFFTHCPKCHGYFSGFHKYGTQVRIGGVHYRIVCHRCTQELEDKKCALNHSKQ